MTIIGCDYHPGFQQIAYVNTKTGELSEARLGHKEEAEQFYHELSQRGVTVRVGMEASGHARGLERLLAELQFELWIGDAAVEDPVFHYSGNAIWICQSESSHFAGIGTFHVAARVRSFSLTSGVPAGTVGRSQLSPRLRPASPSIP